MSTQDSLTSHYENKGSVTKQRQTAAAILNARHADEAPPPCADDSDSPGCNLGLEQSESFLQDTKMEPKVDIEMETGRNRKLLFRVNDNIPIHLLILFAMQQCLLVIGSPLSKVALVSEIVCSTHNDVIKTQMLSATLFMTGIATFLMPLVGVRLPIFQGPTNAYIVPLLAMMEMEEWKCPEPIRAIDPVTNATTVFAKIDNATLIPMDDVVYDRIQKLSGALVVAGFIHFLIGAVGLVGVIVRHVGPVTVVPTVVLAGLQTQKVIIKFGQTSWTATALTVISAVVLSQYLANRQTPIPFWNREKGFHVFRYPLHQVFAILISIIIGWLFCALLTHVGYFSTDPGSKEFYARTDARSKIIDQSSWFVVSYPGQFGSLSFSTGAFINFMIATILSILDSIGDYRVCARTAQLPAPPPYAFCRGIALEGLITTLGGGLGCCHATSTYGTNVGVMSITRVASRQVFWFAGVIYLAFSVLGKLAAFFNTIPYPVLGGLYIAIGGIFIGVILSMLQSVDMTKTSRNRSIVGVAIFFGLIIPRWAKLNPNGISTGIHMIDRSLITMMSNPAFTGGVISCFLDNTIPGTLEERGLLEQLSDIDNHTEHPSENVMETEDEVYELPCVPRTFRKSRLARILPFVHAHSA